MLRKMIGLLMALCILITIPAAVQAATKKQIKPYAQDLIRYYRHHQDAAEDVIWDILQKMAAVDADQAAVWGNIMEDWAWVNSGMHVSENVLPDGLPEDESLCIVVLGYALAEDGTMRSELIDRLVVALASALKYPNAKIAVTGGQTSEVKGATEAGRMAAWLQKKGIEKSRIIVDDQALSTTANAQNVYKILNESYPQVDSIAIVTSDYHIGWGSAMFTTVSNYAFGYEAGNPIDVVAGAVCNTGKTMDTMIYQALGVSTITGVAYQEMDTAPELYPVDRPTEPSTEATEPEEEKQKQNWFWQQPAEEVQEAQETVEEKNGMPVWMIAAGAAAAVVLYIFVPKKPRKKREKPEFKWED